HLGQGAVGAGRRPEVDAVGHLEQVLVPVHVVVGAERAVEVGGDLGLAAPVLVAVAAQVPVTPLAFGAAPADLEIGGGDEVTLGQRRTGEVAVDAGAELRHPADAL